MRIFNATGTSPLILCVAAIAALAVRFLVIPDVGIGLDVPPVPVEEVSPSTSQEGPPTLSQVEEMLRNLLARSRDRFDGVSQSNEEGAMFDVESLWFYDEGVLSTHDDAAFAEVVLSMVRLHLVPGCRVEKKAGAWSPGNAGGARPLIQIDGDSTGGNHSVELKFYPAGSEEMAWISAVRRSQVNR